MTSVLCKEAGESFSRPASGSFPLLPGTGPSFLRSWPRLPKETGARVTTIGKGEKDARKVRTMRLAGRISDWNDDKGYGFVTPNGGGDRAFVHIKAFQSGSRRPVDEIMISSALDSEGLGRRPPAHVRLWGQRLDQHQATP